MTSLCRAILSCSLLVCLLAVAPARAQEQEPAQTPPPDIPAAPPAPTVPNPAPQTPTAPEPSGAGGTTGTGTEGEPLPPKATAQFLPRLDVYFPEGDLDLRISHLINKTFFEGQVKYNFVNGDITAFLRYRYYGF